MKNLLILTLFLPLFSFSQDLNGKWIAEDPYGHFQNETGNAYILMMVTDSAIMTEVWREGQAKPDHRSWYDYRVVNSILTMIPHQETSYSKLHTQIVWIDENTFNMPYEAANSTYLLTFKRSFTH